MYCWVELIIKMCYIVQDEQFELFRRATFEAAVQLLREGSSDTSDIILYRMVITTTLSKLTSTMIIWLNADLGWIGHRCINVFPRCMECQRGLATRKVSVHLSNVCIVTKQKKDLSRFIYHTIRKNIYPSFLRRRMVGRGRPLLPEILGQPTPVGAKSRILNRYSLVAPQP